MIDTRVYVSVDRSTSRRTVELALCIVCTWGGIQPLCTMILITVIDYLLGSNKDLVPLPWRRGQLDDVANALIFRPGRLVQDAILLRLLSSKVVIFLDTSILSPPCIMRWNANDYFYKNILPLFRGTFST